MFKKVLCATLAFIVLYVVAVLVSTQVSFFSVWTLPKFWVGLILCLTALYLLSQNLVSKPIRLFFMFLVLILFSVVTVLPVGKFAEGMGLHPSPMCVIEKPFLFLQAGREIPLFFISIFLFIVLLTVFSNKMFCGWNCPLGAVQEIIHAIPLPKKWKIKLPFWLSNSLRIVVFISFVVLLFIAGFSLYAYGNAFEFMHWRSGLVPMIPFLFTALLAVFIYRPFCYLICPLGLFTWMFEHFSLFKVRLDKQKCTDCRICVVQSPCPCLPAILENRKIRPDCHACGRCIKVCPEKALTFK